METTGRENTNNKVIISGEIVSEPKFSHEVFGESFYVFYLETKRNSGVEDTIPVMLSERLCPIKNIEVGEKIEVSGQYRSYNKRKDNKSTLVLTVFAHEITKETSGIDNLIEIDGFICKPPIYRKTPLGREITDLLIAVNRPYGKSDYIPCIAWGRNALYVSDFELGTHIKCAGRIQSREYSKKIDEDMSEIRIAYEVSIGRLEVIENE